MTVLVADGASGNFEELSALLLSQKAPLAKRFRALFALKAIGTEAAIDVIAKGFDDPSALLCHELAYVLGQMKNQYALNHLFSVLENHKEPMCRHECAEAIGAIKDYSSIERLQSIHDSDKTVQDTILLAIESIKDQSQYVNKYNCIDPAPAGNPLDDNKMILMDQSLDLFTRYRAMFALRDENSISSVKALANGFNDPNPLFRHEIGNLL
jgi:deoxyhypusine monooxygenase